MIKPYYEHAGITIFNCDCREILPELPKNIVCITDPPYGIKRDKGFGGFGGFGKPIARKKYNDSWDSVRPNKETFDLILSICGTTLIFGGNFFADLLPQGKHWIVWDKKNTMPTFGDCELIWTDVDRNSVKIITVEYNGLIGKEEWRIHPTQKPVELIIKLINQYIQPTQTILDPFAGSFTTAVAAKQLGRKCIAIEIEEKYCEIGAKRLRQEVLPLGGDLSVLPQEHKSADTGTLFDVSQIRQGHHRDKA